MRGNTIGSRIEKLRTDRKQTQREVAEAIGVKRETINQWESGTRDLKTGAIVALAKHFGVTSDYILGLSTEKTTDAELKGVCNYTGMSERAVEIVRRRKDDLFFKESLEYLLSNDKLYDKLSSYLFSPLYEFFKNSDYFEYLPLKDSIRWVVEQPHMIEKTKYADILETLPSAKEEMRELIESHPKLTDWLFLLACRSVHEGALFARAGHFDDDDDSNHALVIENYEPTEEEEKYWNVIFEFYDDYIKYCELTNTED